MWGPSFSFIYGWHENTVQTTITHIRIRLVRPHAPFGNRIFTQTPIKHEIEALIGRFLPVVRTIKLNDLNMSGYSPKSRNSMHNTFRSPHYFALPRNIIIQPFHFRKCPLLSQFHDAVKNRRESVAVFVIASTEISTPHKKTRTATHSQHTTTSVLSLIYGRRTRTKCSFVLFFHPRPGQPLSTMKNWTGGSTHEKAKKKKKKKETKIVNKNAEWWNSNPKTTAGENLS